MRKPGVCKVQAFPNQRSGTQYFAPYSNEQSFTITNGKQVLTLATPADITYEPNYNNGVNPITVAATNSAGKDVSYAPSGSCSLFNSFASPAKSGDAVKIRIISDGTCTIKASAPVTFDGYFDPAADVTVSFNVAKHANTITFDNPGPKLVGSVLGFDKIYSDAFPRQGGGATSGKRVTTAGPANVCSPYVVNGVTYNFNLLSAGNCTVTLTETGIPGYADAGPVSQTFAIKKYPQTLTIKPIGQQILADGDFSIEGFAEAPNYATVDYTSNSPSICTISGYYVRPVSVGTCDIKANQVGGTTYEAAPEATLSVSIVNTIQQVISFATPSQQYLIDSSVTLGVTSNSPKAISYTSNTPTICSVANDIATFLATGTCTITASQGAQGIYLAATDVAQSFSIDLVSQSLSLGRVAPQLMSAGSVPLYFKTSKTMNPVVLTSSSPSICTVSGQSAVFVSKGNCTILGNIAATKFHSAAPQASVTFGIGLTTQTITFTNPGTQPMSAGTVSLVASSTSSLPVSLASTSPSVCTVAGNTATLVSAGKCIITASQLGNSIYAAALDATQTFALTQSGQVITFAQPADRAVNSGNFTISASSNSGLATVFASTTPSTCSVAGNTVSLISVGPCSITASQLGSLVFVAAPAVSQTFQIIVAQATMAISSSTANPVKDAHSLCWQPSPAFHQQEQ
jgi:hypothetical protein